MTIDGATIRRVQDELNSSVISDTMDALGYLNQALDPAIRPLDENRTLFGRARTAKIEALAPGTPKPDNPFELTIKMMDSLGPGDVVVRACDPDARNGVTWGELLTTAAMARGAVGLITDGLIRDVHLIREVGFPVFTNGISPVDGGGRHEMVAADVDVECGGIPIKPGDYIFGDVDGIVVIPSDILETTIKGAFEKTEGENNTRRELLEGKSLSDVYDKYGIL
ncbi:MAG: RraA family protein [Chloroflexi bacterium]|jgi:4-hydroxy-4-methyl-2-oxoglutarate aldolase|nr:RraA family protein [Chloroflexota bacterium]MBT4072453.1 RraA family protein [Chloroflexota bacterium]MBT4515144.1 RraA family protein [Chloroflexota bacterium]